MHHSRSRPVALWNNATVPNARDFHHWDAAQYSGLDGVNGGTWSPLTPIGLGGNGVTLASASRMAGGFTTKLGGRYLLGANDYPVFSAANRTRTVRFPIRGLASGGQGTYFRKNANLAGRPFVMSGWTDPNTTHVVLPIPQRWIHNGATLLAMRVVLFLSQATSAGSTVFETLLWDATSGTQYNPSNQWIANHSYAANSLVIPLGVGAQTGFYYKTTAGGTSSASAQPTPWPNSLGNTVVDGTVTWTCQGFGGTILPAGYSLAPGVPGVAIVNPSSTLVMNAAHAYALEIDNDGAPWVFGSCELDYTTLSSMAFQ